jgi:hypothetical protein
LENRSKKPAYTQRFGVSVGPENSANLRLWSEFPQTYPAAISVVPILIPRARGLFAVLGRRTTAADALIWQNRNLRLH